MVETTGAAKKHPIEKLLVTVGNETQGERLTKADARDTAEVLMEKLPTERIAAAQADGRGTTGCGCGAPEVGGGVARTDRTVYLIRAAHERAKNATRFDARRIRSVLRVGQGRHVHR
jgi:hypothetical protein